MAKVKQVHTCKACGTELYTQTQIVCHMCGFRLQAKEDNMFSSPDYLYYQKSDFIGNSSLAETNTKQEVEIDFNKWLRNCPEEDVLASLQDSLAYMKHIILSGSKSDTVRHVVATGVQIGSLAAAIENYIKNRGAINVTSVTETEPTDGFEG